MTNLRESQQFQDWVTMAVCQVLGQSPCGVDRKWALTYAETRVAACQVDRQEYFYGQSLDSMRLAEEAFTNMSFPAGKRHLH